MDGKSSDLSVLTLLLVFKQKMSNLFLVQHIFAVTFTTVAIQLQIVNLHIDLGGASKESSLTI